MAARAVRSFRAQTYANKRLLIYDNGKDAARPEEILDNETYFGCFWNAHRGMLTIGQLRHEANGHAFASHFHPKILIHWDDDDYSHPARIAEQVALLQASGADAVGYREMLFWRTTSVCLEGAVTEMHQPVNEAWLYSHHRADHALGTSLCYWRRTWERKPFADLPKGPGGTGEDHQWREGLKVVSQTALGGPSLSDDDAPRMIASIHGGNSSKAYDLETLIARGSKEWRRVPEWDDYCAERMKL